MKSSFEIQSIAKLDKDNKPYTSYQITETTFNGEKIVHDENSEKFKEIISMPNW